MANALKLIGKITLSELDEAIEEKNKIYQRLKEVRALANSTEDGAERIKQTARLKVLRDMYNESCERVERLRPQEEKKHKAVKRSIVSSDAGKWDFFERNNSVWADIGGYTWNTLGMLQDTTDANSAILLNKLIQRAYLTISERQKFYIQSCFIEKKSVSQIADQEKVNRSSVCRTIRAGLNRMESAIISCLYAYQCIDGDKFDHLKWAEATEALTERQREMLFFLLTDDASMSIIANYMDLNKSSVSKTNKRIVERIVNANNVIPSKRPSKVVKRKDWIRKSEEEIAAQLGISKGTYYRNICRNKPVGDIPRFAYECLIRKDLPVSEVAKQLNCSTDTVKKYWRKYENVDVEILERPKEYVPQKVKRKNSIDVRLLLSNVSSMEGTIGSMISAETYRKMVKILD